MYIACRHIKTNGYRCRSRALSGSPFCYFHSRVRSGAAATTLTLPIPEDLASVLLSLHRIGDALIKARIDNKTASQLVWMQQISMQAILKSNAVRGHDTVSDITVTGEGDELAPVVSFCDPGPECVSCIRKQFCSNYDRAWDQHVQALEDIEQIKKNLAEWKQSEREVARAQAKYKRREFDEDQFEKDFAAEYADEYEELGIAVGKAKHAKQQDSSADPDHAGPDEPGQDDRDADEEEEDSEDEGGDGSDEEDDNDEEDDEDPKDSDEEDEDSDDETGDDDDAAGPPDCGHEIAAQSGETAFEKSSCGPVGCPNSATRSSSANSARSVPGY